MTLQETAFMIDLIKSSYRRRMFYFFLKIVPPVVFFFFIRPQIDNIVGAIGLSIILFILILAAGSVFVHDGDDISKQLPWIIKKEQTKALNECTKRNASFGDLGNLVCLHEYFFI